MNVPLSPPSTQIRRWWRLPPPPKRGGGGGDSPHRGIWGGSTPGGPLNTFVGWIFTSIIPFVLVRFVRVQPPHDPSLGAEVSNLPFIVSLWGEGDGGVDLDLCLLLLLFFWGGRGGIISFIEGWHVSRYTSHFYNWSDMNNITSDKYFVKH